MIEGNLDTCCPKINQQRFSLQQIFSSESSKSSYSGLGVYIKHRPLVCLV